MILFPRALLVGFLLLLAANGIAGPLEVLQDCADRAVAKGAQDQKLIELCPDMPDALKALSLDRQINIDLDKDADFALLADLAALAARYAGKPGTAPPKTASLQAIVERVNGKKIKGSEGWWERFKSWVRQWITQGSGSESGWFKQLSTSKAFMNSLFYGSVLLVAAIALVVIVNELRAMGLLGSARKSGVSQPPPATPELILGLTEDRRSPLTQLLLSLVAQLVRIGSLRAERALTHRELVAMARFAGGDEQQVFRRVVMTAEAATYGASGYQVPGEVISEGESLLGRLRIREVPK